MYVLYYYYNEQCGMLTASFTNYVPERELEKVALIELHFQLLEEPRLRKNPDNPL